MAREWRETRCLRGLRGRKPRAPSSVRGARRTIPGSECSIRGAGVLNRCTTDGASSRARPPTPRRLVEQGRREPRRNCCRLQPDLLVLPRCARDRKGATSPGGNAELDALAETCGRQRGGYGAPPEHGSPAGKDPVSIPRSLSVGPWRARTRRRGRPRGGACGPRARRQAIPRAQPQRRRQARPAALRGRPPDGR